MNKNTALITGASGGIGKELAKAHAAMGGDLVLVARNLKALQEVKAEIETTSKVQVFLMAKDLSLPNAAQEVYDQVQKEGIQIEYLMNNAGFGGQGYFHQRSWEQDHAMILVNIVALTELTRLFLPGFVERNSGRILNTSSTAALMPGPLQAVYFASKAYVLSFSEALFQELSETNVTVTALLPGAVDTGFAKTSGMEGTKLFAKTASPQLVAKAGYRAMLLGKREVRAGLFPTQRIMLRLNPLLPKSLVLKYIIKGQAK